MSYVAVSLLDDECQVIEYVDGLLPGENRIPSPEAAGTRSMELRQVATSVATYKAEGVVVYETEFREVMPEEKFQLLRKQLKEWEFVQTTIDVIRDEWNCVKEFMFK